MLFIIIGASGFLSFFTVTCANEKKTTAGVVNRQSCYKKKTLVPGANQMMLLVLPF